MPVTDDKGELLWRYRWMQKARDHYRYEMLDIEPGTVPDTIRVLRKLADALEQGLEWIGGETKAKEVGPKIVAEIKAEIKRDEVDEMMKKFKGGI